MRSQSSPTRFMVSMLARLISRLRDTSAGVRRAAMSLLEEVSFLCPFGFPPSLCCYHSLSEGFEQYASDKFLRVVQDFRFGHWSFLTGQGLRRTGVMIICNGVQGLFVTCVDKVFRLVSGERGRKGALRSSVGTVYDSRVVFRRLLSFGSRSLLLSSSEGRVWYGGEYLGRSADVVELGVEGGLEFAGFLYDGLFFRLLAILCCHVISRVSLVRGGLDWCWAGRLLNGSCSRRIEGVTFALRKLWLYIGTFYSGRFGVPFVMSHFVDLYFRSGRGTEAAVVTCTEKVGRLFRLLGQFSRLEVLVCRGLV